MWFGRFHNFWRPELGTNVPVPLQGLPLFCLFTEEFLRLSRSNISAGLALGKILPAMTVYGVPCCSSYQRDSVFSSLPAPLSQDVPPAALLTGPPRVGCALRKDTPGPQGGQLQHCFLPNGAHRPLGAELHLHPCNALGFQSCHGFTKWWLTPHPTHPGFRKSESACHSGQPQKVVPLSNQLGPCYSLDTAPISGFTASC